MVANLDTFEPDLKRKLEGAIRSVSKSVEKDFDKLGAKAGKSFSDAAAKVAASSKSFDQVGRAAERMERTTVDAAKGLSDGFKLPLTDVKKLERAVLAAGDSQSDALGKVRIAQVQLTEAREKSGEASSAAIAAEERLATAQRNAARDSKRLLDVTEALVSAREAQFRNAGEVAGQAAGGGFSDGFRRTARDGADDGGREAGGFFAQAFETAASRAVGAGLLRVFAAGVASLVTAASPLGTVLGGATAAVVALTSAIGLASGSAISLLGVLGALGLAGGTLKVGFSGIGDAMKEQAKAQKELAETGEISAATQEKLDAALKNLAPSAAAVVTQLGAMAPAWRAVRQSVQETLFTGVATAIQNLGTRYLPILQTQLGAAATTLNRTGLQLAKFLTTGNTADQVTQIFSGLNEILGTLLSPVTRVAGAFLTLFQASLPFAQRLAEVISGLGERFADFINQAVSSGAFNTFMENAFTAASQLFTLLGNLGRIIGTVFAAGAQSGVSLLQVLGNLTGQLADFLKSAEGQQVLADFFGLIGTAAGIVTSAFRTLQPLLAGIGALFQALEPALQQLGTALLPVIAELFVQVGAALSQLAPLFAALVVAVTPLAAQIGTLLVTAFTALAPVVVALVQGLVPLVTALVTGLVPAFAALTPLLLQLSPILVQVATSLLASLLPAVQALTPLIPLLVTGFAQIVAAFIQLLPSLLPLIPPLTELSLQLANLLVALAPLIPPMVEISTIAIGMLGPALSAIVGFTIPVITTFTNLIATIGRVVSAIVSFVAQALERFSALRSGGAGFITSLAGAILGTIGPLVSQVIAFFQNMVSGALRIMSGWISSAAGIAGQVASGIISAVRDGLSGLPGAFRAPFDAARSAVSGAIEGIVGVVSNAVGRIQSLVSKISSAVGGIKVPGFGGIDIPGFAKGTIATKPTLGVFGEAGPEAVIPLDGSQRSADLMDQSGLTAQAMERILGNGAPGNSGGGKVREINMPVTVAGLTKEETLQLFREFLENTFGPKLGLSTAEGGI